MEAIFVANEIVKKHIIDDLYSYSISYDAGVDCGPVAGMHLTGGIPVTANGTKVVKFDQKYKGQQIHVKYDTRSDLAALVAEYEHIQAQIKAEREAKWAAEKAAQDAIDRPLIEKMEREAAELRAQIPEDHVEVTVTKTGDLDGWPILEYKVGDTTLNWDQVNMIGSACAVRPGALGAFAEVWVASISRERLEEIRAQQQADAEASRAKKEAREKELRETPIPQEALSAYRHYHGDADAAWENEDEAAWALIEKWTPYIEAQHGIDAQKLQHMLKEAAREASYGISEG